MSYKIGVLFLLFTLLTSGSVLAAENTLDIPGVGTMIFPEEIELLAVDGNKCSLLVNDNGVFRGCQLSFSPPLIDVFRDKIKDNTIMIDALTNMSNSRRDSLLKESPDVKLLDDTPLDLGALNNEQFIIKSITTFLKGQALHFDYYAIDRNDGILLLSVFSIDGNREFWRSKFPQIIANIQR